MNFSLGTITSEIEKVLDANTNNNNNNNSDPNRTDMIKDKDRDMVCVEVRLPDGAASDVSVSKKTAMMDFLVQVATTYHFQPAAHYMLAFASKSSCDKNQKNITFTPNTKIGTIPVRFIHILPKNQCGQRISSKSLYSLSSAPISTDTCYRLKICLPRNQFYVMRVMPHTKLSEVFQKVCYDKSLDPCKYDLKLMNNNSEFLDGNRTLFDYGQINEIYLIQKEIPNPECFSTQEIISMKKSSIDANRSNYIDTPSKSIKGQLLSSIFNKNQQNSSLTLRENQSILSSLSSSSTTTTDSRSDDCPLSTLSSQQSSDDNMHSSVENLQNGQQHHQDEQQQQQQQHQNTKKLTSHKKRRPAPNPPPPPIATIEVRGHSRNSSDSSGYHETSISSDNYGTLPTFSDTKKNLMNMKIHSKSMGNLQTPLAIKSGSHKTKKPAPLPPVAAPESLGDNFLPSKLTSIEENQQQQQQQQQHKPTDMFFGPKYLTLESLDKRRSMLVKRELTTLNKEIIEEQNRFQERSSRNAAATLGKPLRNVVDENDSLLPQNSTNLPNFSISTYNNKPKSEISIYEDDSVRSSNQNGRHLMRHCSVSNLSFDSCSSFSPKKVLGNELNANNRYPVLTIKNEKPLKRSVSNACFKSSSDLQSLNVMRTILPQLHKKESEKKILNISTWTDRSKPIVINKNGSRVTPKHEPADSETGSQDSVAAAHETVTVKIVDLKMKESAIVNRRQFKYTFRSTIPASDSNANCQPQDTRSSLLDSIRNFGGTAGFSRT